MDDTHPSLDITGSEGSLLKGKRVALGVTGSVAAVRAEEIARALMRRGAEVRAVMSEAATRIVHPDLLHWATGRPVVTRLTGAIEHVALAGNVPGRVDLVIVAPATANTIGKIAAGIDDTPVTSLVTSGLGQGIPLLVVPAMHESMYRHPLVVENVAKLERIGVAFLMPRLAEGKAKIAETEDVVASAIGLCVYGRLFNGKKVLVSLGRTVERLDPIRVLTNNSSGRMGAALARAALALGAGVTVVAGKVSVALPGGAKTIAVSSAGEMFDAVRNELAASRYDHFIAAAAVGDWRPVKPAAKKISTHDGKKLTLELEPTPKIIDRVKEWSPRIFLTAFRAVHGLSQDELVADGLARLKQANADLIVANDASRPGSAFEADTNDVTVISTDGKAARLPAGPKSELAFALLALIHGRASEKK
jgi:phosphopantothenoylcysteine decarboxylase/phosphopantothenate--cysteine ligase